MVCTYSGDPSASPKDAVRFLVGDTDCENPLLQDAEIEYLLEQENGNVLMAAYFAAKAIAANFARLSDLSLGDFSISFGARAAAFESLAHNLEAQAGKKFAFTGIPFAGGISKAQKKTTEQNKDRVEPSFYRDMMDNKRAAKRRKGEKI